MPAMLEIRQRRGELSLSLDTISFVLSAVLNSAGFSITLLPGNVLGIFLLYMYNPPCCQV